MQRKLITIEEHLGKELPYVRRISQGFTCDSNVYRITEDLASKIYLEGIEGNPEDAIRIAKHELSVSRALFSGGVSVPKPEGIFLVPRKKNSDKKYPAFVMEYIEGLTLSDLRDSDFYYKLDELWMRAEKELNKAIKLGFDPYDMPGGNFLWSPIKDKLYLIDFCHWEKSNGGK